MRHLSPFDWTQARAFLATVEAGSLSQAAKVLGLTQPTLSRQVAGLEARLGVVLFERVGRALVLTETGREMLDHFRDMGAAAERIALAAAGQSQVLEGRVTISASDAFAVYVLVPLLPELQQIAPGIEIDLRVSNTISDLQRREADIAVRHLRPVEPELVGRQVGEWRARLYAATSYLDRRGRPSLPADLAGHDLLGFAPVERLVATLNSYGLPVTRRNVRHATDNGLVLAGMAELGLGVGVTPELFAARMAGLEPVLPDWPGIPVPLWLIAHRELRTSRRIRMVFDYLAEALSRS